MCSGEVSGRFVDDILYFSYRNVNVLFRLETFESNECSGNNKACHCL
jgi:hypothetical protein